MGDGTKAMEQHGNELDDEDEGKEEHKHQTNGLQLQVFLADEDLKGTARLSCFLLTQVASSSIMPNTITL